MARPNLKDQLHRLNERRLAVREKRREEREQRAALSGGFSLLRWFGLTRTTGFVLLAGFMALRIWDPAPLENLRWRSFDFYQALKPRVAAPDKRPAVIVDIDEASLRALGQWPWPRTLIAELVARLQKAGAVVVAFDILMTEPDRMSPANVAQSLPQIDQATRDKMKSLPSNDDVLAAVMSQGKVVMGQAAVITPTPAPPQNSALAFIGEPGPFL
ncbi:MAG: CHASE2 domain-containing protein, partial [Pseudorhodoplanes sp.]